MKTKYTPHERALVYRQLARIIFENKLTVCEHLWAVMWGLKIGTYKSLSRTHEVKISQARSIFATFPEFGLFHPNMSTDTVVTGPFWYSPDDNDKRVFALLVCEQMAIQNIKSK